jgi:hypothetical protein
MRSHAAPERRCARHLLAPALFVGMAYLVIVKRRGHANVWWCVLPAPWAAS